MHQTNKLTGKFIVLDGPDGCGKTTQTKLLAQWLEEQGVEVKLIGTVKWFSLEKGYGFITKADGKDLFFHRADISRRDRTWPKEGQQVEFQIRQSPKGPEAFNVSLLPTD